MIWILLFAAAQEPAVAVKVDCSQVPELADWAAKAKALCEEWYPRISESLASAGFAPPKEVTLVFEKEMKGVAHTLGNKIHIAADWVKKHPEDTGMVIHELTHVVQDYRGKGPGWVTEGIADHVRYFQYEKKAVTPKDKRRGAHTDGYRTTASFFAWVAGKHDKDLVRKLNAAMRAGTYKDEFFKEATGRDLAALWKDYLANE